MPAGSPVRSRSVRGAGDERFREIFGNDATEKVENRRSRGRVATNRTFSDECKVRVGVEK